MLGATAVLARAQLHILRNSLWRAPLRAKIGNLLLLVLGGLGALGAYGLTRIVVAALQQPGIAAELRRAAAINPGLPSEPGPLLAAIPGTILFGALGLLVFSSFGSLLSALFLAKDLDTLLVAPVPLRAVFAVKFFGGLSLQYLILLVLLAPALLAYGQGRGFGLLYQLSAALTLLFMPLLPAGVAALLVMLVVRVIPARRAREIVGVLGGLLAFGFAVFAQLGAALTPRVAAPGAIAALTVAESPLLPSTWAGRALLAAGSGDLPTLAQNGGLFLFASLGVFAACLVVAERFYHAGWSDLASAGGRVRRRAAPAQYGAPRSGLLDKLGLLLPRESLAVVVKDLRLFRRDLRNLQALIFPLALAGVWGFQLLFSPGRRLPAAEVPAWAATLSDLSGAAVVFFICISISGALAGGGISREGRAFWQLKLAPLSPLRLLLGKLVLALLPYPLLGTILLLALGLVRGSSPLVVLQQWAMLQICGLGCAALAVGLGAAFPRLDWEHPGQQTTWQAGCLGAVCSPSFLVVAVGLVAGASALAALLGGALSAAVALLGWVLAAALAALVAWLSLLVGARGVERIEI